MKKQTIFLVPTAFLMMAVVTASPAFASNDEGPGNAGSDVSCSTVTAPEDTETHTPRFKIITP